MSETEPGHHVVVVGASLAGTRVALNLRTFGFAGRITLIGSESEFPYDRPPLSKGMLLGDWSEESVAALRFADAAEMTSQRIDVRLGVAATALETAAKRVDLADGSTVEYDTLVIATGAVARPSPWQPESGVYQLRTLDDSRSLAARLALGEPVVVVGGGFIGTEVAAAARSHGCEVVVVDPVAEPMARLVGAEIASVLVGLHGRHGTETRFGVGVAGIGGRAGALTITLADGSELSAGTAVVGIGSVPCTGWLETSGLVIDNGVLTDAFLLATGADDIYALGDVARWPHPGRKVDVRAEHWTNAGDQARYVAMAIVQGGSALPYQPTDYVWSDQYDWKVNSVGWRDPEGRSFVVGDAAEHGRVAVIHEDASGIACGAVTINWVKALNQARRLLNSHSPASDLVDQLQQLA